MINHIRSRSWLTNDKLEQLTNILRKQASNGIKFKVSKKSNFINLQNFIDAIKPNSNIRTNVIENYRFKN